MKRSRAWPALLTAAVLLAVPYLLRPQSARADAPAIQLAPLEYADNLSNTVKSGYIDVSNPTDTTLKINSQVRGFKQRGSNGDLDFFDDPDLAAGISVGLPSFDLGPREAIRVAFSIDPAKLPHGALYGVIFFNTVPADQTSQSSYVSQSAAVGTLLELNNGANLQPGIISSLTMPWLQVGDGLRAGAVGFQNPGHARADAGIRPKLSAKVLPWGSSSAVKTGLVLPDTTRQFGFSKPGSYLGILSVTIANDDTGAHRTAWVIACTGAWRVGLPILIIMLGISWLLFGKKIRRLRLPGMKSWIRLRQSPKAPAPALKRNIDSMGPKAGSNEPIVIPESPADELKPPEN